MMLRKPSEVDHLEKYYIANYTAAIYYKHCILTTKKIFLKKLFKSLYNHKKALKDDLDRHILEARDQDYLDQLLLKCKKEVLKMQQNLRMNTNPKSGQICTEMERRFFNQLHQTLQVLTDGSLRNTLLSHKHKSKALQERLHLVSKYLI
ncbi:MULTISPECIES: hypothetical protein [Salegentibacter]|uniref:Uncharacterized protein n=1 Tax=Salegentibacter agarivorans TaxID=345907 RepID=A0A1I2QCU3_9FLAO|nr:MULTISPECIES: hypothetical protein [Salegentibacter]MBO2545472.1 hypothetical protein [Salegentibacter sp. BDJ18]SFG23596.1 hypothetical protein SAMN04488033_1446 [Salegentibacter agarivorans]|tara:strand:+ start:548 stop:994 length:447 start_codon:yes stop_codon:yes gene_type:complete